jgi:hypothetical protein
MILFSYSSRICYILDFESWSSSSYFCSCSFCFKFIFLNLCISLKEHMSYYSRSTSPSVSTFLSSSESIIYFPLSSSIFVLISINRVSSLSLSVLLSLLSSDELVTPLEQRLFFYLYLSSSSFLCLFCLWIFLCLLCFLFTLYSSSLSLLIFFIWTLSSKISYFSTVKTFK